MNEPGRHPVLWSAVLAWALLLAVAARAAAGIPNPTNWSIDSDHINLVGIWSMASDRWNAADSLAYGARVTVTVRDIANNPVAGVPVVIDFSGCPGLGRLSVGVYDQTGTGGLTLADISYFWSDLNSGTYHPRSDLDGNGTLTLADVSYVWAANVSGFDVSATSVCSNPPINPPPPPPPGGSYDPGPVGPGPKRYP